MTKNANLQLIQYKVLHRFHLTGRKLFKMGFSSETCSHCTQNTPDTYLHAIWYCTSVKKFWENVTDSLSDLMGCHIPLSPFLCILGDISIINLNSTNSQLLLVALTIAKKTILMNWKLKNTIHITTWKNLLIEYISMENLSTSTQNNTSELHPSWSSLFNFLQSWIHRPSLSEAILNGTPSIFTHDWGEGGQEEVATPTNIKYK